MILTHAGIKVDPYNYKGHKRFYARESVKISKCHRRLLHISDETPYRKKSRNHEEIIKVFRVVDHYEMWQASRQQRWCVWSCWTMIIWTLEPGDIYVSLIGVNIGSCNGLLLVERLHITESVLSCFEMEPWKQHSPNFESILDYFIPRMLLEMPSKLLRSVNVNIWSLKTSKLREFRVPSQYKDGLSKYGDSH